MSESDGQTERIKFYLGNFSARNVYPSYKTLFNISKSRFQHYFPSGLHSEITTGCKIFVDECKCTCTYHLWVLWVLSLKSYRYILTAKSCNSQVGNFLCVYMNL